MKQPLVYFVQCHDAVKIGKSIFLPRTLQDLQRGNPYPLQPIAVIPCDTTDTMDTTERDLQKHFSEHHIRGEWFTLCPDIEAYIESEATCPQPYLQHTQHERRYPLEKSKRQKANREHYQNNPKVQERMKAQSKKQGKTGYFRERAKHKRLTDPQWRAEQNQKNRDFREKNPNYMREYYHRKKKEAQRDAGQLTLFD